MSTSFPQMDFYPAEANAVIAAYRGPPKSKDELARSAQARQAALKMRYDLTSLVAQRRTLEQLGDLLNAGANTLTDDFAPAETLKATEAHNRQWPPPSYAP
jgi:hypothetical protein